jgi:hypothetical protein
VEIGDDECGLALEYTEILLEFVNVPNLTDVFV